MQCIDQQVQRGILTHEIHALEIPQDPCEIDLPSNSRHSVNKILDYS